MALLTDMDITVCQRRVESASYKQSSGGQGGQRKTKVTAKTKYLVVVKEKSGGPALSPSDLNPLLIVNAAGLPKTGRSCYSFGGLIAPFLLCNSKQIERDSENGFVFHVSADWESIEVGVGGGGQSGTQSPEEALQPKDEDELTPENFEKEVVVSFTTSSQEYVAYEAETPNGDGTSTKKQSWKLPNGTPFEEPVIKKLPLITLNVTQFEDEITLTDLETRSFAINTEEWNSRDAGSWLIAEIEATEVTVNLGEGDQDMWRVSYTIHLCPNVEIVAVVDGEPYPNIVAGDTYNPGWTQLRPLVDTFYKKPNTEDPSQPDELVPNTDVKTGYVEACYIYATNGTKRTPTSTDGTGDDRPSYMMFETHQEINFSDFLKWPGDQP